MRNPKGLPPSDKRKIFYNARRIAELALLEEIAKINDLMAEKEDYPIKEGIELKKDLHFFRRAIKRIKYSSFDYD